MRNLVVAALFVFVLISSCKKGAGKLCLKLEMHSEKLTPEMTKLTEAALEKRLSEYGLDEDDVSITSSGEIISVQISEISNYPDAQSRIPKLLLSDAHLGFWETYSMLEILQKLESGLSALPDSSATDSTRTLWTRFTSLVDAQTFQSSISPQSQDYENCLVAYVSARDTANMAALIDLAQKKNILPAKFHLAWTVLPNSQMNPKDGLSDLYGMIALKSNAEGTARLDKPVLADVRAEIDKNAGGRPVVNFVMQGADADAWRRMTAENIHKSVAIVIDGSAYSWPTVQGEIPGGVCTITGNFSDKEVDELVNLLHSESLPVPLRLVEKNILP